MVDAEVRGTGRAGLQPPPHLGTCGGCRGRRSPADLELLQGEAARALYRKMGFEEVRNDGLAIKTDAGMKSSEDRGHGGCSSGGRPDRAVLRCGARSPTSKREATEMPAAKLDFFIVDISLLRHFGTLR